MTGSDNTDENGVAILKILHFNDVYNVEEQKTPPFAGAARFVSALKHYGAKDQSIVLFSGDALSPSMISTITQGRHMPKILNEMFIKCAVLGNHDLDFGLDILCECLDASNFPWLNSNIYDRHTHELLGNTPAYHVIQHAGLTIGLIGLLEREWVETLSCVDPDSLYVADICEVGRELARKLKQNSSDDHPRCDIVIALTHMRWPNDRKLAQDVPEIDLILGGHDHNYEVEWISNPSSDSVHSKAIIKSGTDFRNFSSIHVHFDRNRRKIKEIVVENVVIDEKWEKDQTIAEYVTTLTEKLDQKLELAIGRVEVPLDARFSSVRTKETNVGNFIADIILTGVNADVAMVNSGTLRADRIIPAGEFKLRDLINLLPLLDPMVVLKATGAQILKALENGVSQYPKLEGRFPIVSGVRFAFDPTKPAGSRVSASSTSIQGAPLELEKSYRLCVKHYMAGGKDGYDVLKDCPVLLDDENGPILSSLVQNYFRTIQVLKGFERSRTGHRQSIVSIAERHRLLEKIGAQPLPKIGEDADGPWEKARMVLIEQRERQSANAIAPVVDGRIRNLRENT